MAEHVSLAKTRRPYRLGARAASMATTRQRITQAAVELHGTVGPSATTMKAVAERAGVTRATLYRHFPHEAALFTACSADWLAANPRPDLARWATIADPMDRIRVALAELYAYYRATEDMRANLLRDLDLLPPAIRAGISAFPSAMVAVLDEGWPSQPNPERRHAAIGLVVAFDTWRSLARDGLTDEVAGKLMVGLVALIGRHGGFDDL